MIDDLKPCPFCGSHDLKEYYGYPVQYSIVKCQDCGGRIVLYGVPQQAAQAWNRRADND